MHWIWKSLVVLSLAMNLVGYAAHIIIVDKALEEANAQIGELMKVSKDQQQLRREVNEKCKGE